MDSLHDDPADLRDLKRAVALLEKVSVTIQIADAIGSPLEWALKKLPSGAKASIQSAVKGALQKAVTGALLTLRDHSQQQASTRVHKVGAVVSGFAGGFFGLAGTLVEIPVTTMLMMRSVADVARSEGFDLADLAVQAACVEVFAMGGRSEHDDAAESGYYATRLGLAEMTKHTAAELARMAAEGGAKRAFSFSAQPAGSVLARLIDAVATRFGVVITEKTAAQIVPVLGGVAAATINGLFTDHYQAMARGHFIVKRLEAKYGEAAIERAYGEILGRR